MQEKSGLFYAKADLVLTTQVLKSLELSVSQQKSHKAKWQYKTEKKVMKSRITRRVTDSRYSLTPNV